MVLKAKRVILANVIYELSDHLSKVVKFYKQNGERKMSCKYDDKLSELEIFRVHPTLKPFIGENYEKYKILHIGESHYLSQTVANEEFDIRYFVQHWWKEPCDEVLEKSPGYVDTRNVVGNYLNNRNGAYGIFTNVVKEFSKIILNSEITQIDAQQKQLYRHFAFMNFFLMPSLFCGRKYWDSLCESAKKLNDKNLAFEMWHKCAKISARTVDDVIDIISPNLVIFTSVSAKNAYFDGSGKHRDSDKVIFTSHPAAPFSWNKRLKSLGHKTGKEALDEGLLRFKSSLKG